MKDKLSILIEVFEDLPSKEDYEYAIDDVFDAVHAAIASRPQIPCVATHTFTKGLYCRELTMPPNIEIISKWHNTQHQFVVLEGKVEVFLKFNKEWVLVQAPKHGITEPGTRRILRTLDERCVWLTFHPTDIFPDDESEQAILEAVKKIEDAIIYKHVNKLLGNGTDQVMIDINQKEERHLIS